MIAADEMKCNILIGYTELEHSNTELEHSNTFTYLGSIIMNDRKCSTDVKAKMNKGLHVIIIVLEETMVKPWHIQCNESKIAQSF